ncbi:MAG TPA: DUF3857 domain-containing protein, partial [Rhodanobacteraceae bacterium]|nr:DUF3857 domain-containing protein [Rhodanobacteraceae bacterium]
MKEQSAGGAMRRAPARWRAIGIVLVVLAVIASTGAHGAAQVYRKGDYQFEVAPAAAWVVPHEVAATWDPAAPGAAGARWRNWLSDIQVDRRGGRRERYIDAAYEPVSSELTQDAGKYQIWFSPDYERLILHRVEIRRDGVWHDRLAPEAITLARRESAFERDMSTGVVSALIVLDDVRPRDVIRVAYTISGANPVLAGSIDEEIAFGYGDPLLQKQARVLYDPDAKLIERRDRAVAQTRQRRDARALEWSAEQRALPGLVDEGSYPAWYAAVPRITVGVERSWADVAAWARALYPRPAPLPADLEQRIAEWRALATPELRI